MCARDLVGFQFASRECTSARIGDQFNQFSNTLGPCRQAAAYHFKRNKRGSFTWLPFTFTIFLLRFFYVYMCFYSHFSVAAAPGIFFRRIFFPIQIINYVFECVGITLAQLLNGGGISISILTCMCACACACGMSGTCNSKCNWSCYYQLPFEIDTCIV